MLEAAADAGLDVGASKGGHLAQLPRDLDGFMEQEAQLSLVARVPGRCHLAEKVWTGRTEQMMINIVKKGRKGDIYYHIVFFFYIFLCPPSQMSATFSQTGHRILQRHTGTSVK